MQKLENIKACVFDAYGTIFDLSSATARCAAVPVEKRKALSTLWREKQLQYTWLRSLQNRYADFEEVTANALDFALETLEMKNPKTRQDLLQLFFTLDAFPEVSRVLASLKAAGITTAILSNGTPRMLAHALEHTKLKDMFDHVLSADDVKIFKTHPRVYEYGLQKLGLQAHEISFQSSNAWDAYAASAFGMRVVWCNRYEQKPEHLPGRPDYMILTLDELIPLVLSR